MHRTSFHAIARVVRDEGILGLYGYAFTTPNHYRHLLAGYCTYTHTHTHTHTVSAGLLRQASYSTVCLGIYQSLFDKFSG